MLSKNINRKVLPKVWKFLDKLFKKDEIEIVTFDPADLAITFRADTPIVACANGPNSAPGLASSSRQNSDKFFDDLT